MFIIVTYPWLVASAHVELTGPRPPDAAVPHSDGIENAIERRAQQAENLVRWTAPERLRFSWYGLRLAVRGNDRTPRAGRPPRPKLP